MSTPANWEFQSISIDFEVFKALTARLEAPQDTYNDVLRGLLKLGKAGTGTTARVSGKAWVVDGIAFQHGTEFRARYKGALHLGCVDDGALVVNGKRFYSPSPAAIEVTGTSVNGWKFWEYRRPGHAGWSSIDGLRGK